MLFFGMRSYDKNVLQKMFRIGGKSLYEEGTAGTPRRVFIRNPYYKGPDPMKQFLLDFKGNN